MLRELLTYSQVRKDGEKTNLLTFQGNTHWTDNMPLPCTTYTPYTPEITGATHGIGFPLISARIADSPPT